MQEFPILDPPATVLHLIQNIMILLSFLASVRWGWREFRVRRNGNGKKRRASDTLPGLNPAVKDNPNPEHHELRREHDKLEANHDKLEENLKEHQRWARERGHYFTGVLAKIGQRIARIEGRLNGPRE